MPYTLSHAVISLPVYIASRGKIPIASMIVGSMSPDFPYLLALTTTAAPGHSILGVLIYCLIPSLLMLLVWYRWLEKPALDFLHLPQRTLKLEVPTFLLIVLGVLFSAYSHALWDATSHSDGSFVVNSEFWHQELFTLPLYKWNQYGSGVFGLVTLLLWYIYALIKNRHMPYKGQFATGALIYAASICFFVLLANITHGSTVLAEYVIRSAIGVLVGTMFGMCWYAYWIYIREGRHFV
ncbi:MAG: hypothetical protein OFPII_30800 [Osedax symbiont Rs1]|nr:MAG: hypothetical protein OFPII_30800 [Osedax symbiont Rs1]